MGKKEESWEEEKGLIVRVHLIFKRPSRRRCQAIQQIRNGIGHYCGRLYEIDGEVVACPASRVVNTYSASWSVVVRWTCPKDTFRAMDVELERGAPRCSARVMTDSGMAPASGEWQGHLPHPTDGCQRLVDWVPEQISTNLGSAIQASKSSVYMSDVARDRRNRAPSGGTP